MSQFALALHLLAAIDIDPFFTADPNPPKVGDRQPGLLSFQLQLGTSSPCGRGEDDLDFLRH